jgi:hypothetical protein
MSDQTEQTHIHSTGELLDLAIQAQGIRSDYKLALLLDAKPSAVCNWRQGRSHPSDDYARKIAQLANYDPGYVLTCIHADRAPINTDQRALWRFVASRLRTSGTLAAAGAAVALAALALPRRCAGPWKCLCVYYVNHRMGG